MHDLVTDLGQFRYQLNLKASAVEIRPRKTWYQGRYYAPANPHDSELEERMEKELTKNQIWAVELLLQYGEEDLLYEK
jgi:hypothetical protein